MPDYENPPSAAPRPTRKRRPTPPACDEPRRDGPCEEVDPRCKSPRKDDCEPGLRKVVERTWYYDDRDDCRPCEPCEPPCHGGQGGGGGDGDGDCGGGTRPGRPTRPAGTDDGRGTKGGGLTPGDIDQPDRPGVWGGPRADLNLPYLFMRANPADLGARPIVNAPFWESPDIFILKGVDPAVAPRVPPQLGQSAQAGAPNTIYAHVWNFGNAAANEVLVEFYWVNPSLGIGADSVNLIAQTVTSLGPKGSARSHAIVKCPTAWVPTFVNGGHECLLVRIWDNPADLPGQPPFDAAWNRHVAQRNIHVDAPGMSAGAMGARVAGSPALVQPIVIKVGPLFGAPATVAVERVAPSAVPWLQLKTGTRGLFPAMAPPTGVPSLSAAASTGGGFPTTGAGATHTVHGDDKHVAFSTTDAAPAPGEAHVYRVTASQDGSVFGGYTIVLMG